MQKVSLKMDNNTLLNHKPKLWKLRKAFLNQSFSSCSQNFSWGRSEHTRRPLVMRRWWRSSVREGPPSASKWPSMERQLPKAPVLQTWRSISQLLLKLLETHRAYGQVLYRLDDFLKELLYKITSFCPQLRLRQWLISHTFFHPTFHP